MFCRRCGREIPGNARYCPGCGSRQEMGVVSAKKSTAETSTDKRKRQYAYRQGSRLGNFLVSLIALVILFSGAGDFPDTLEHTFRQMSASCFTVQNQKEMAICSAEGEICTIDIPEKVLYSENRCRMAFVDQDGELYDIQNMTPVFVDDQVTDAKLSFYGDTLVYIKNLDDGENEVCIYDTDRQTCERTAISECREFTVSPDGKTVACLEADEDGTMYLWHSYGRDKMVEIAENVSEILAVSDRGRTIFYRKNGDSLFCYSQNEEKKTVAAGGGMSYILNETQTEILYMTEGNTWYYSTEFKEPVRLTGVKGSLLICRMEDDTVYRQGQGLILDRKTLKNLTFATCDTGKACYKVYHLDGEGKTAELILNYAEQFQISENGQSVLYLSDQKLYEIRDIHNSQNKICLSSEMEVSQFAADRKLQRIWFAVSDRELYFVKNKECVNLTYDLNRMQGFCMDGVLFQEGQTLYYTEGTKKVLLKEDVEETWIQEKDYAVIRMDGGFYYLKDLKDPVSLSIH